MDPELRPRNAKVILDFFSKCRLCTPPENGTNTKPLKWSPTTELEDKRQPCMTWVKKDGTMNTNMYFYFHGKNTLVRRILFEWFVGPTQLTEREKKEFQKKRSRSRKKPRRLSPSCSYLHCIYPCHLVATPPVPEYFWSKGEDRQRRVELGKNVPSSLHNDVKEDLSCIDSIQERDEYSDKISPEQVFAKKCLIEAGKLSFSILERIERIHLPSKCFKRKRKRTPTAAMKMYYKKPMLRMGDQGLNINKVTTVIPFRYEKGGWKMVTYK
ncbi:MAG: hypothetical protein ACTSUE_26455 [Promethearchaeota archaeon]